MRVYASIYFNNCSDRDVRKKQVVDFKRIFAQVDRSIPILCVCGNHDVGM